MNLVEQFAEPHEWWDSYTERKDAEYAALVEGKTCLDCGACVKCGREGHEGVGWCPGSGEFVTDGDYVAQLGLECFEAA